MHSRSRASRRILIATVAVLCGGCERSSGPPDVTAPAMRSVDYKRYLRQGVEQMRRQLYSSAAAELAKWQQIKPDDPELLFQFGGHSGP